jgi:glycosyltransferase involved in cell wall biosynthesis
VKQKKLSVIICCYNERATIRDVIARSHAVTLPPHWEREILVVDNASTDGTREILAELDVPEVRVFFHSHNMGKGMSIRTGIANMTGDYMIIQDADSEYDPAEHSRFVAKADETGAAAIFGSRVLGGQVRYKYAHAYLGVRVLTTVANLLFGGRLTDIATATKMVRGDVAQSLNLTTSGFNLDFEMPGKILLTGHEILEIPITYDPRTYAEGKKIRSIDGIKALLVMFRDRLGLSRALKPTSTKANAGSDA